MLAMASIDLFTDSVAILNSIVLKNILWHALGQMRAFFGYKFDLG